MHMTEFLTKACHTKDWRKAKVNKPDVARSVRAFFRAIPDVIRDTGEEVIVPGVGTFEIRKMAYSEYKHLLPNSVEGDTDPDGPRYKFVFKPGKTLKERTNRCAKTRVSTAATTKRRRNAKRT